MLLDPGRFVKLHERVRLTRRVDTADVSLSPELDLRLITSPSAFRRVSYLIGFDKSVGGGGGGGGGRSGHFGSHPVVCGPLI